MPSGAASRRRLTLLRQTVQLIALSGFAILVGLTATSAAQHFAVPALAWLPFRLDPLVAVPAILAGTVGLGVVLWGLGALLLALVAGRAFCGWLCPLGTALDVVRRCTAPLTRWIHRHTDRRPAGWLARLPLLLLTILLAAACLGLPLIGLVEPMALAERAAATAIAPWCRHGAEAMREAARPASDHVPAPGFIDDYRFIGAPVRGGRSGYDLGWISAAVLAVILLAEIAQPRAWCRWVCPSGALLGLAGRWSLLRRLPGRTCGTCRDCVARCRMGAFTADGTLVPSACTACLSCVEICPSGAAQVAPVVAPAAPGTECSRRDLLLAGLAGAALPLIAGTARTMSGVADPHRIRPPGVAGRRTTDGSGAAASEDIFLEACVRCGACVQACPTSGLQPVLLADGLKGMFAPRLVPRHGPCEHGCRACMEVCPTHAIPLLTLADKRRQRLGLAVHDHRRCLPWSGGGECRVCWEHCPVPDKAITLKLGRAPNGQAIPLPGVDAGRCVGCGTCEFVCPIEGDAGIRVADRAAADTVRLGFQPTIGKKA